MIYALYFHKEPIAYSADIERLKTWAGMYETDASTVNHTDIITWCPRATEEDTLGGRVDDVRLVYRIKPIRLLEDWDANVCS